MSKLKLEGRTYGYNCVAYKIGKKWFCWMAIKQFLAAWAVGFEIADRTLILFFGPLAFAMGRIEPKEGKTNA
ncbi:MULTISPECIES: hypothetical protein [Thalassospira]|uniref:Uncharacterized protein n=1 Tax=Thalassospira alkalitolerans TaxID=1293890 RepID=A0A1Y2LG67_9PROT|nr:hypothetical protein [Thalassospira alkalitolerans]OSQ49637.1 hypothetical protein TALK_04775 [Thalassospira alkalitolerans]